MPATFFGLFLFSTALALICTFTVLGALKLVRSIAASRRKEALPPS